MADDSLLPIDDDDKDEDLVKEDDVVKEDGTLDGDFAAITENDPTVTPLDLEEEALAQDRTSEPAGLDATDPGVDDEEDWERKELERGAGGDINKSDLDETYGMHIVDADAPLGSDDEDS